MGITGEGAKKVHLHDGPSPRWPWRPWRRREGAEPGLPFALPVGHVLNYLQDWPPWCGFVPDRAQVRPSPARCCCRLPV